MSQSAFTPPRSRASIPSILTLAFWRARRTWRLLLLAGAGILIAVMLVCTAPLYSEVVQVAGLRGVLTATPQDSEITLQTTGHILTPRLVNEEYQSLNHLIQSRLGAYLQPGTKFFIYAPELAITSPAAVKAAGDSIGFIGASIPEAAHHLHLLRGRLPQPLSQGLEVAITQNTAGYLKVDVGSVLTVRADFRNVPSAPFREQSVQMSFRVVGIIAAASSSDPYWHGQTFDSPQCPCFFPPTQFLALMSNDTYLAALQQTIDAFHAPNGVLLYYGEEPTLFWYYHLNASHIGIAQLDDLIAQLRAVQTQLVIGNIAGPLAGTNDFTDTQLYGPPLESSQGPGALGQFRSRTSLVNIPVTLLLLQVLGLILMFVGLMGNLLVDYQTDVIALLRSRGASRRQIFGAFLIQSLALALFALLVGPLLAIPLTRFLAGVTLPAASQQALSIITGNPLPILLKVGWFAAAAALGTVLAMAFAVRDAARRSLLEMRRESARPTRRPFWQRLYLDIVAVVIALTGAGLSLYVTHSGALDAQTSLLISAPLALVAPIFLAIAGLLLFLRAFPPFLRLLARLVSRRPGAAPMLALAQMARAPGQAIRLILLLALASSFAGFALVFLASETQHLQQVADYQAGADFSGLILHPNSDQTFQQQADAYRKIAGITSATLGYSGDAVLEGNSNQPDDFTIRAVDASTFAQTAIWTSQDSSQSLAALMQQLLASQGAAREGGTVPAIVDALTWQTLNLHVGDAFKVNLEDKEITFSALAEVMHIPTINDSLGVPASSDYTPPRGILVDYQTLAAVFGHTSGHAIDANYVWLRTSDDPALLARIRAELSTGPLALQSFNDRRAMLAGLQNDPLYLALQDVLILGTAVTVLLALVGNLTASWLSARTRLTNFALLRALGSAPRQIATVLTWEQTLIYTTAIALGALLGALLAGTIVPALIFTGVPNYSSALSTDEFYTIQHVLPAQVIVPPALVAIFAALVVICAGAIGMMARLAFMPSISQVLRLNTD